MTRARRSGGGMNVEKDNEHRVGWQEAVTGRMNGKSAHQGLADLVDGVILAVLSFAQGLVYRCRHLDVLRKKWR